MQNSSSQLPHKGFCWEYGWILITGQHLTVITAIAHVQVHCAVQWWHPWLSTAPPSSCSLDNSLPGKMCNVLGVVWGFLISTFKTAAGYSIQDKQGHPAPMEHEGSWSLLHLLPQTSPEMWRLPVGLMANQSSTTSPNSFSEGAAPFVSK